MDDEQRRERRRYSTEDIATALVMLRANDFNMKATAAQLDIPEGTLRYWSEQATPAISPEDLRELRAKKTAGLADAFDRIAWACIESITKEKLDKANLKDSVIASAIATEKRQLLRGEPTAINVAVEVERTVKAIMEQTNLPEVRVREIIAAQMGDDYPATIELTTSRA